MRANKIKTMFYVSICCFLIFIVGCSNELKHSEPGNIPNEINWDSKIYIATDKFIDKSKIGNRLGYGKPQDAKRTIYEIKGQKPEYSIAVKQIGSNFVEFIIK